MNKLCNCHDLKQVDSNIKRLPLKSHLFCVCFCFMCIFNAKSHDSKQVDSTVRELPLKSHLFCAHARPQSSKEPLHLSTKAGWLEITVISCQVNFSFRMRIVRLWVSTLWVSKVISPQNGSECHRKQWEGHKITKDNIFQRKLTNVWKGVKGTSKWSVYPFEKYPWK